MASKLAGQWTLTEKNGNLSFKLVAPDKVWILEFQDGKSLVVKEPVNSPPDFRKTYPSMVTDSLEFSELTPPPLMPFNFRCRGVFHPLHEYKAEMTRLTKGQPEKVVSRFFNIAESNTSVEVSRMNGHPFLCAANLLEKADGKSLSIGVPGRIAYTYKYTHLRKALGVSIPGNIQITAYSPAIPSSKNGDESPSKPITVYDCELVSLTINPGAIKAPAIEEALKDGDWISYNGTNGAHGGVVFQKSAGPFLKQLTEAVVMRKKYGK